MTEGRTETGVVITTREIYRELVDMKAQLSSVLTSVTRQSEHDEQLGVHDERIRKLETQVAAQWIIVGIVVTAIGAVIVKTINGG